MKGIKAFICGIGLHWMEDHEVSHVSDRQVGGSVYKATCACGKSWLVKTLWPIVLFKVYRSHQKCKVE